MYKTIKTKKSKNSNTKGNTTIKNKTDNERTTTGGN